MLSCANINCWATLTLLYSAGGEIFNFQWLPFLFSVHTSDMFLFVSSGKHEEKKDEHGYVSRNFTRKYTWVASPGSHTREKKQNNIKVVDHLNVNKTKAKIMPTRMTSFIHAWTYFKEPPRIIENEFFCFFFFQYARNLKTLTWTKVDMQTQGNKIV